LGEIFIQERGGRGWCPKVGALPKARCTERNDGRKKSK
jgi:hypothetical protein